MTALILDLALARRIELAEAQAAVDCAETLGRMRPAGGGAVELPWNPSPGDSRFIAVRVRRLRRLWGWDSMALSARKRSTG